MRKEMKIFIVAIMLVSSTMFGQEEIPKYGKDTLKCKQNLSLYSTFVKQKNYEDAMEGWRYVFNECPRSTKNIYLHGVKIYKHLIKKNKDKPEIKEAYIDTLMMIYDQRIKYFGEEGKVLGRKGVDLFKYRGKKALDEAYGYLTKSLEMRGDKTEGGVLVILMKTAGIQLKKKKETCDNYINFYAKASDAIDAQIKIYEKKGKSTKNLLAAKSNVDNLFIKSECASCEAITPIFSKKFEKDPENVDLLKNIVLILGRQNCTDDPLYANAAEKLISIDSTAIDPFAMGKLFKKKGEYNKAVRFYKQALEIKTAPEELAEVYYELAEVYGKNLGQKSQGRTYAYEAIKQKADWGKPYLLIGSFYASSSNACGKDDFEKKTVVWAAVDKFIKAKTVDPSIAADANRLISQYSAYFPLKSEGFFRGINEGASYTIGCWINETTTARFTEDE